MSNNIFYAHPHSPSFAVEEEGEWVTMWVPKNAAAPISQAGSPESHYSINTAPLINNFDTMSSLNTFAATSSSSVAWDHSPLTSHFDNIYPSPSSPSTTTMNDFSSQFTNSPAEALLDDFNMDFALLGATYGSADPVAPLEVNPVDLFSNLEMAVDFSDLGLDDFIYTSPVDPLTPDSFVPPVASPSLSSPTASFSIPSSASPQPPSPPAQSFACSESLCTKTFDKLADLRRHERKHRQPFRCDICNKGHLDKRALSRHLWAQHPEHAQKTNTRSERTKCTKCDYEGRADNVARHMKRHSKAKR
ncbi:hypothetical protein QBC42DRAFT_83324 [Cladorrhinum samala]|uniref:C2H2-type domain-containing protein n=1 Tax=Cladorrhinum samala TaxID=585594 RepID=A0AAV9HZQ8_9PEZI|nr:hypothetical protein QBC42DRAFT_83324 [Cladorrhinum samala]